MVKQLPMSVAKKNEIARTLDWTVPSYHLDYSKVIDRSYKNLDVYNKKFELWDKAQELDQDKRWRIAGKLLKDTTIFTYAMFGIKLRWYQDMIASDDYRFKIFCAANQIGKSYLLNIEAIKSFLTDHGYGFNRVIVSQSLRQAVYQMNRIKNILKTSNIEWKEERGDTDNVMKISLNHYHDHVGKYKGLTKDKRYKYTNYLIVAPRGEGVLGYDLNMEDLDEFDFWDCDQEHEFNQHLQPRTYETKGGINIYSNPNGKERYMWELWNQKLKNGQYKWHRYKFDIWDKPGMTQEQYDTLTVGMSPRYIESTMLAEFTSGEGAYFNYQDIILSEDKSLTEFSGVNKQTFHFLDIGSNVDHSVFTSCYVVPDETNKLWKHAYVYKIHEYPLGYPLYRVVGSYSDKQLNDGWHHEKSVKEYLVEASAGGLNPKFGCDVHKNDSLTSLFESIGIYPIDMGFSGPKKFGYYENLNYMLQKRLLHRIPSKKFVRQFSNVEIKGRAQAGYLMLHGAKDSVHDDIPDSVSGCVYLATQGTIMPGLTVVTGDGKVIRSDDVDAVKKMKDVETQHNENLKKKIGNTQVIGQVIQTRDQYLDKKRRMEFV